MVCGIDMSPPPYDIADGGLFHCNAYSVLHGDMLYMMYLVASIDCLDLVSKQFSKIYLPAVVRERTRSWTDYTVCHHNKTGLALVQYWAGNLETWVLMSTHEGGGVDARIKQELVTDVHP